VIAPNYFHIGLMKTGSTFIQSVFENDQRINLFRNTRIINTNTFFVRQYEGIDYNKINVESDENVVDQKNNQSSLEVCLIRLKQINPDIKFLVTIREQRSLLVSAYKHLIRQTQESFSFSEFLNSSYGQSYLIASDYNSLLKRITNYFPINNVCFVPFEKIYDRTFVEAIYQEYFAIDAPLYYDYTASNVGVSDRYVVLKRKLNKHKIFNSNSRLSNLERKVHSKLLSTQLKIGLPRSIDDVEWGTGDFFKKLETQFSNSNKSFEEKMQIDLPKFNYLPWG
jgi:hypothetical protein